MFELSFYQIAALLALMPVSVFASKEAAEWLGKRCSTLHFTGYGATRTVPLKYAALIHASIFTANFVAAMAIVWLVP